MEVGSGITIRTGSSGGGIGLWGLTHLYLHGTVIADLPGETVHISVNNAEIYGHISVSSGAVVHFSNGLDDDLACPFGDFSWFTMFHDSSVVNLEVAGPLPEQIGRLEFDNCHDSGCGLESPAYIRGGRLNTPIVGEYEPAVCVPHRLSGWPYHNGNFTEFGSSETGGPYRLRYRSHQLDLIRVGSERCDVNLASLNDVLAVASSPMASCPSPVAADHAVDETPQAWCSDADDVLRDLEIDMARDVTVSEIVITPGDAGSWFQSGRIQMRDVGGTLLYDSGELALNDGGLTLSLASEVPHVRTVHFDGISWEEGTSCITEIEVFGPEPDPEPAVASAVQASPAPIFNASPVAPPRPDAALRKLLRPEVSGRAVRGHRTSMQ